MPRELISYITIDGLEFNSKEEATAHENSLTFVKDQTYQLSEKAVEATFVGDLAFAGTTENYSSSEFKIFKSPLPPPEEELKEEEPLESWLWVLVYNGRTVVEANSENELYLQFLNKFSNLFSHYV